MAIALVAFEDDLGRPEAGMTASDSRLQGLVERVLRARSGSEDYSRALDALGRELLGSWRARLIDMAHRILHNEDDAKDVVSTVIARFIQEPRRFKLDRPAVATLLASVGHASVSELRRRGRWKMLTIGDDHTGERQHCVDRALLEASLTHQTESLQHWIATADGRALEAEESRLVMQFALCETVRGTFCRIPSGMDLRERLAHAVEQSFRDLLAMGAEDIRAGGFEERYADAMMLLLHHGLGLSVKDAWERLRWIAPGDRPSGLWAGGTAAKFDKKEKDRINARTMRARAVLEKYLLDNGYRMGGEL